MKPALYLKPNAAAQASLLPRHQFDEFVEGLDGDTNNFALAAIYKARWQIGIFFKWIKRNLKAKMFLGTSKNAVLTQIGSAMCYCLMLAYVKYQTRYKQSLFYLHRLVRETLLECASLFDLLSLNESRLARLKHQDPQLCRQH